MRKRKRGDKARYFAHPLPHHRHLEALQWCDPHPSLAPALLSGEACEGLTVIQGPPGTGKTHTLVEEVKRDTASRILLCAPTNVGAINLYKKCLADPALEGEVALALAAQRVPPGTTVLSTDLSRRILCGTLSSRAGVLHTQSFQSVYVDEAAQCMEALVWTLLRREVSRLVLAGDVFQLPALVSSTGRELGHERSLMERLVTTFDYQNVIRLRVQNRMAPQLMALPNALFYEHSLQCGEFAPPAGEVVVHFLEEGEEEAVGTSVANRWEADACASISQQETSDDVTILCGYSAQCQLLLSRGTGRPVHTIDSFQGHEADVVILSLTRTHGIGFWDDARRLTVALTRARRKLHIVASHPERWPEGSPLSRMRDWLAE